MRALGAHPSPFDLVIQPSITINYVLFHRMGPNGLEKVNKKMFFPCDSYAMNDLKGII